MRRMTRFLAAWLAWLAFASAAFAGYDARIAELRDQLAANVPDLAERAFLSKAVEDYIAARNQTLDELSRIVEDNSVSNNNQEQRWKDRLATTRGDLAKTIGDSLKNESTPTVQALAFRQTVVADEDKFLSGLSLVRAAEARDTIVDNHQKLDEWTRNLDEKWRAMLEQDKSLDDGEKSVIDELNAMVDKAVDEIARQRRAFAEKLAEAVATYAKAPLPDNLPDAVAPILQVASVGSDYWLALYSRKDALVSQYRGYVDSERGGVYVLFTQTRQDTQHFLDDNGFDRTKKRYQDASDALGNWRSSLSPSGQKNDADAFSREVLNRLSTHLSATEQVFNAFVSRNQYKFFGPVGPDIRESLVEQRVWIDRVRMIEGKDLESRLRDWRSDVDNWWNVDMTGLKDFEREELKRQVRDRVAQIVDAEEKARAALHGVNADFDRSALADELK